MSPTVVGSRESGQDPDMGELPPPRGTLFVLTLYIIILTGMWSAVYWIMLQRS